MLVRGEVSQATCAWKSLIPKKKKKKKLRYGYTHRKGHGQISDTTAIIYRPICQHWYLAIKRSTSDDCRNFSAVQSKLQCDEFRAISMCLYAAVGHRVVHGPAKYRFKNSWCYRYVKYLERRKRQSQAGWPVLSLNFMRKHTRGS